MEIIEGPIRNIETLIPLVDSEKGLIELEKGVKYPLFLNRVITGEQINDVIDQISESIAEKYGRSRLLLVNVPEGANFFTGEVRKRLENKLGSKLTLASLRVNTYSGTKAIKQANILRSDFVYENGETVESFSSYDSVLVLDDIWDTGKTMDSIMKFLSGLNCGGNGSMGGDSTALHFVCLFEKKIFGDDIAVNGNSGARFCNGIWIPNNYVVGNGFDLKLESDGVPTKHLFRKVPGVYTFNEAIEDNLLTSYRNDPTSILTQLPPEWITDR
ncbi:hypothetical protein K8R47_00855 [archaeon]|nr:hypothetical protein [archaeon]